MVMVWVLDSWSTRLVLEGVCWPQWSCPWPHLIIATKLQGWESFYFSGSCSSLCFPPFPGCCGHSCCRCPKSQLCPACELTLWSCTLASSAVTSHCTADSQPSCIPHWVRVEGSGFPPCYFCQKHARLPFPPLLHICLHNYKEKVGLKSLGLSASISRFWWFFLLPFTQSHPSFWPWREVSTLVPDLGLASWEAGKFPYVISWFPGSSGLWFKKKKMKSTFRFSSFTFDMFKEGFGIAFSFSTQSSFQNHCFTGASLS